MLQGSRQSLLCSFVFDELPNIYKSVCKNRPLNIEINVKTIKTPVVKCEQCKFKSSMIQMKMHVKAIHRTNRPKRVTKRMPNFSLVVKPAKKSKHEIPQRINILLNSEGINDESILLVNDTFSGKEATLEEDCTHVDIMDMDASVNSDNKTKKLNETKDEVVQMKALVSCDKCDFDCETQEYLREHINEYHKGTNCTNCAFTSEKRCSLERPSERL